MSPAKQAAARKAQAEKAAQRASDDALFRNSIQDQDGKHTSVHRATKLSPFTQLSGPLPEGWHKGISHGVAYYWHDGGGKQLHLPAVPYLARMTKEASGDEVGRMIKGDLGQSMTDANHLMYKLQFPDIADSKWPGPNLPLDPTKPENETVRSSAHSSQGDSTSKSNALPKAASDMVAQAAKEASFAFETNSDGGMEGGASRDLGIPTDGSKLAAQAGFAP